MRQWRQANPYLPFGYKLMLSFCVLILIPVLLVGYTANSIFVGSIREQTRENIRGTLEQMKDNIGYKMAEAKRVSDMLYFDYTLGDQLRHYQEGWVSYEATTKYLLPKLRSTLETSSGMLWLSVYLHNETLPEVYQNYGGADPLTLKNRLFDLYHIRRITDKAWYREYPQEKYGATMRWQQVEDDAQYGRISLLRRIVDTRNPLNLEEIGFIRISVRLADLFESVDYNKIGQGTTLLVADEERRSVVISAGAEGGGGADVWRAEEAGRLYIREELPGLPWKLTAVIPPDITERDTEKVRTWTILICLGCIAVFLVIGYFISRYFSRRVSKIVKVLDSFQEGEFDRRLHFKGRDEFTQISEALNEMGQHTGNLIQEVYLTRIQKKEAELESLQAQINPHFLYNTLSSISRLAKFGQTDKLQRMVLDLAKFYRLSLNEGRTVIPVSDELAQAQAYMNIQQTKYEERLRILFDIQPEILPYTTVKLILQPFIENALEHAWCGDRIHIRIVGRLEQGNVVFKIIDDGIGMDRGLIRQVLDPVQGQHVGYGIRNVDQRIRLHYGRQYGVEIESRPGMGTGVRITVPALSGDAAARAAAGEAS
ncbi:sensor histidine kinase YesM [Paenibacillus mucilaginosus]|uniref:sensor histidine kinase n=1 Tax=Paenibacillus mucilaginosus TaxID=61624 RepID=UPI003D1CF897